MKYSGGEDSDDAEWYSDDEDDRIAKHSALTASELSAGVAAVAKSAGEVRLPGLAEYSVSTEPELAACPGEAGLSWYRKKGHDQCRRHSSCKNCW